MKRQNPKKPGVCALALTAMLITSGCGIHRAADEPQHRESAQDSQSPAYRAGEAAQKLGHQAEKGAEKAAHELREGARELKEGWRAQQGKDKDADKKNAATTP